VHGTHLLHLSLSFLFFRFVQNLIPDSRVLNTALLRSASPVLCWWPWFWLLRSLMRLCLIFCRAPLSRAETRFPAVWGAFGSWFDALIFFLPILVFVFAFCSALATEAPYFLFVPVLFFVITDDFFLVVSIFNSSFLLVSYCFEFL